MEAELGIGEIGNLEKSVLMSIADIANEDQIVSTKEILQHALNRQYSRPSLFRALKKLELLGRIVKVNGRRGCYQIV